MSLIRIFVGEFLAGKRAASLLLPPQRTAQATFTAYGSGTAKASIVDTGLAIPRKSFADVISLVHLVAETRALNCLPAASFKLPYVEPQIRVHDSHTSRKSAPFRAGAKLEPLCTPLQHAIRLVGSPTASRQRGPRRTVRASFPAYSSSTALSAVLTPVLPLQSKPFANVTSLIHLIAEAKGAESYNRLRVLSGSERRADQECR